MIGLRQLQSTHAKHGKVVFINIRKKRREPVVEVNCVHAISGEGLEGDRYNKAGGGR